MALRDLLAKSEGFDTKKKESWNDGTWTGRRLPLRSAGSARICIRFEFEIEMEMHRFEEKGKI